MRGFLRVVLGVVCLLAMREAAVAQTAPAATQLDGFTVALTADQYSQLTTALVAQGAATVTDATDAVINSQGVTANLAYDAASGYMQIFVTALPASLSSMTYDQLTAELQSQLSAAVGVDLELIWYPTDAQLAAFLAAVGAMAS